MGKAQFHKLLSLSEHLTVCGGFGFIIMVEQQWKDSMIVIKNWGICSCRRTWTSGEEGRPHSLEFNCGRAEDMYVSVLVCIFTFFLFLLPVYLLKFLRRQI